LKRRVLIMGIAGARGAQLARELERDPRVEAIVGVDEQPPPLALDRTEFVRLAAGDAALRRVLRAAQIDTVVDTRWQADVEETEALVASLADAGVDGLVVCGSAHVYGCSAGDPAYFEEDMALADEGTELERRLRAVEEAAVELRACRPGSRAAILRLVEVAEGDGGALGRLLSLPGVVPGVAGFDPRVQLLHPDDAVAALEHAVLEGLDGTFNVAADGVLALSELASLLDRRFVPVLPPWGSGLAAVGLRHLGAPLPPEAVALLRHGRAVDNRRLKATGFRLRFTAREAALELRRRQRVAGLVRTEEAYRYDEGVEEFLRRSPAVRPGTPMQP
jgi:UDP-glucose 4-epimerase